MAENCDELLRDEMGWPIRTREDGVRVCARPSVGHYSNVEEFRINGYCSNECQDMHELEEEIRALQAENESYQTAIRRELQDRLHAEAQAKELRAQLAVLAKERDAHAASAAEALNQSDEMAKLVAALAPRAEALSLLEKWLGGAKLRDAIIEGPRAIILCDSDSNGDPVVGADLASAIRAAIGKAGDSTTQKPETK